VIFLFLRNLAGTPSPRWPSRCPWWARSRMYLLGFSLNNLSVMALTISTRLVVDDAIVMTRTLPATSEEGESPMRRRSRDPRRSAHHPVAHHLAHRRAHFRCLFMGDVVGRLFREFALTLGITILISPRSR